MARVLFALLFVVGCSAAPFEVPSQYDAPSKGFEAAGSAAEGVHTGTPGGSGGTSGGTQSLSPPGGSAGALREIPVAGSGGSNPGISGNDNGGTSASGAAPAAGGAGSAGSSAGTAGLTGSVYDQCGDGTCIFFETAGNIAPCPTDCWGTCGNGVYEPQDLWLCPADGTPTTTTPPAPGSISYEYPTSICDQYAYEPYVTLAYCDASKTACLDDWANQPANAIQQRCWMGVMPHNVPSGTTNQLKAPAGTYTVSAAMMTNLGVIHLDNFRNVVVAPGAAVTLNAGLLGD